jgi:hypothetical protein
MTNRLINWRGGSAVELTPSYRRQLETTEY